MHVSVNSAFYYSLCFRVHDHKRKRERKTYAQADGGTVTHTDYKLNEMIQSLGRISLERVNLCICL